MNLQLRDGVYDENLNKTPKILDSIINNSKAIYIIFKGRRYEILVSKRTTGSIDIIDVTESGKHGGKVVALTIHGVFGDSLALLNSIPRKFIDDTKWYIDTFKKGTTPLSDLNNGEISIGDNLFRTSISIYKSNTYFSLLGNYKRLIKRPKKWNVALLIRALLNFQVKEINHYHYDDMRGAKIDGKSPLTINMHLARSLSLSKPRSIVWSYNINSPNIISVYQHSNEFYDLEIIDEKLFKK